MARFRQDEREQAIVNTRQKLITAGIGEFSREGFASANINRISEAAGFAKGTIYNYFPSKQALMLAIIEELGAAHVEFITSQVRLETDPKARLVRFFVSGFAFVENHPLEAQFLISTLYAPDAAFREPMGRAYQPMFGLVGQEILAPGIAEGVFRQIDPALYSSLLMTLYLGTCSQVDANGKPLLDPHQVAEFALNALSPAAA